MYDQTFEFQKVNVLLKSEKTMAAVEKARWPAEVPPVWQNELSAFRSTRAKYLLYR